MGVSKGNKFGILFGVEEDMTFLYKHLALADISIKKPYQNFRSLKA